MTLPRDGLVLFMVTNFSLVVLFSGSRDTISDWGQAEAGLCVSNEDNVQEIQL